jgi:hypothetical protein
MINAEVEIVSLYENEHLTIGEIAAATGYEPLSIKALLSSKSGVYRQSLTKLPKAPADSSDTTPELNTLREAISETELLEFIDAYKNIARYAEMDGVRERALKNLINMRVKVTEGLGESNVARIVKDSINPHINILVLNEQLKSARQTKERLRSSPMFGPQANPAHEIDAMITNDVPSAAKNALSNHDDSVAGDVVELT